MWKLKYPGSRDFTISNSCTLLYGFIITSIISSYSVLEYRYWY